MDVAWVLLVEVRDGAKARKKLKKKRKATSEEHDGDDSDGGGGGDGEDETAGGGGGGAAKPAKKKKGSTRRKNSKRVARRRYVAVQLERNNKPAFLSFIPRALAFSNPRIRQRGALQATAPLVLGNKTAGFFCPTASRFFLLVPL